MPGMVYLVYHGILHIQVMCIVAIPGIPWYTRCGIPVYHGIHVYTRYVTYCIHTVSLRCLDPIIYPNHFKISRIYSNKTPQSHFYLFNIPLNTVRNKVYFTS